jgi:hypothetical protein
VRRRGDAVESECRGMDGVDMMRARDDEGGGRIEELRASHSLSRVELPGVDLHH